jgi:large subunit ribosomal protein L7/L12
MTDKIQKIIEEISNLTVVELNELVKSLEEKFGVSQIMLATSGSESKAESSSSQSSTVDIYLIEAGSNKLNVIKVIREIDPNLSLKDAKDLVDNPPQKVAEKIDRSKAEEIKKKFEEAGAKVELK